MKTEEKATVLSALQKANKDLMEKKDRSCWKKGVNVYALELMDYLINEIEQFDGDIFNRKEVYAFLLNGAEDWSEYSYGGCSLIYDGEIAERLCNQTELKRTKGGEYSPFGGGTWLDVQARALEQAVRRVFNAIYNYKGGLQ